MNLDSVGYHQAKNLISKAEEFAIKFHYLPPYSLNLNLIERLWKVMNKHVRNNQCFPVPNNFKKKLINFFDGTLPQIGADLNGQINNNFQCLNHVS